MKKLISFLLICSSLGLQATHNRAGEITYTWKGGLTYEARITTYTRSCNFCADRCELELNWGDGSSDILQRSNGTTSALCTGGARDGEIIDAANEIRKNVYIGQHTYSVPGPYILFVQDPNRNAGINNIPNSDQIEFYIQSEIFFAAGLGGNSSPILTEPPIERGCVDEIFEHNAGAVDLDGDSLSYRLVPSRSTDGDPISTIYDRQFVQDSVRIDPVTGDFVWDVPRNAGQFNFAFEIIEWRRNSSGRFVKIGFVTRDMQIDIEPCGNKPPVVDPVGPFCVEAGQTLTFSVTARDPDDDDLELSAFGGPFEVTQPADDFFFEGPSALTGIFRWDTECLHVRKRPYPITFKAKDDPPDRNETPLSGIHTTEITVIAPAPKNPQADAQAEGIALNWNPARCTDGLLGYTIFRRESQFGFIPDDCETGVPEYTGYELLDSNQQGLLDTTYLDTHDLQLGVEYCYMVVAYYDDGAESYASREFCAALPLSLPLLTKVDVDSTDAEAGIIDVEWVAPPELDSAATPPPYRYKLWRSDSIGGQDYENVGVFDGLFNTSFRDSGLNTPAHGYHYRLDFFSGPDADSLGSLSEASSVFLDPKGSDQSVELRMRNETPWNNERFVIYREIPTGSGNFDSIAESFSNTYLDTGLVNGEEYCYRVTAFGRYGAHDSLLPYPLINRSQIACAIAQDTVAPCQPELTLRTACPDTAFLSYRKPPHLNCPDDVMGYNVYFRPPGGSFGEPILTINSASDTTIRLVSDASLFGCYAVSAFDDAGQSPGGSTNESKLSEEQCLESCFELEFPNVFTPNGDGINDFFLPINYNQLASLRIDIYNRWGKRVYRALSLEEFVQQGWDGTVESTGLPASEGVYYYLARYREESFNEAPERVAKGFVHLMR